MMQPLQYYFAKLLQKMQIAAVRNCLIDKTARVCQKSNLVNVTIGRYSYVGAACSINNVSIGSFCSIASYCAIGGGNHPISYVSTSPVFLAGRNIFKVNFAEIEYDEAPCTNIGNDVWIGEACFIRAGVNIGDGAIIGAHAVVTKDVPPYAVVAGVPAEIIRFRFDEETIRELLNCSWWDWPEDLLSSRASLFYDPAALLSLEETG